MSSLNDDYFASLGGNLIKDLLADLQVDDNEFSLELLEKELSELDKNQNDPSMQSHRPLYGTSFSDQPSAAAIVVSHAQNVAPPAGFGQPPMAPAPGFAAEPDQNLDAWSLSLKNFTSMSLEQEFLAADSVRRQHQNHHQQNQQPFSPPPGMQEAEDYDVNEEPALMPPPGLSGGTRASKPPGFPVGAAPAAETREEAKSEQPPKPLSQKQQPPPPSGSAPPNAGPSPHVAPLMPPHQHHSQAQAVPNHGARLPPGMNPQMVMPPQGIPVPMPHIPFAHAPPPHMMHQIPQVAQHQMAQQPPQQAFPIAMPVSQAGKAWQQPPQTSQQQQQQQPTKPIFCNPLPSGEPVSAALLKGKIMNARDVAYVIHSMLKPVLSAPVSEDDYYIQMLQRVVGGGDLRPNSPRKPVDLSSEMTSRAAGSKQWSANNSTLGHVVKTNVSRPRALIAVPSASEEGGDDDDENKDQRQRATLWKARIYCDQAYQAHRALVQAWKFSPNGAVSPQVQLYTKKLLKCIGMTMVDEEYRVDVDAFRLLVKLRKGRVLLSRILDQAVIPPNAAQAILPASFNVFYTLTPAKDEDGSYDRVLFSLTHILNTLNVPGPMLVTCLESVRSKGKASLSTTSRMKFALALLQKGAMTSPTWESEEDQARWRDEERQFNQILQEA